MPAPILRRAHGLLEADGPERRGLGGVRGTARRRLSDGGMVSVGAMGGSCCSRPSWGNVGGCHGRGSRGTHGTPRSGCVPGCSRGRARREGELLGVRGQGAGCWPARVLGMLRAMGDGRNRCLGGE